MTETPDSKFISEMTPIIKARSLVYGYVKSQDDTALTLGFNDVLPVWFCKTLKNWKALVITTLPDDMYYEVTYNGEKNEWYLDAYKKVENVVFTDEDN